ncbi:hypothetical protein [Aquibacillus rhizosphaerae]|uniref:Uncharacterized protein n=1 Tax=Aquibacillus rhizosphaerae TaxID=3051431 RepID=A0ABT7L3D9_9BACI|nr:hypothetical protein [Aquibacillus sp. LR5S19]MDL4840376.1 hypothetical protein [Aquibacillus sp. LR5S19]
MKELTKFKKGLLALLTVFMVSGIVTGCSGDEDTDTDGEDTETEENSDEGTEESED